MPIPSESRPLEAFLASCRFGAPLAILALGCSLPSTSTDDVVGEDAKMAAIHSLAPLGDPPVGRWTRYLASGANRGVDVYVAHNAEPKPIVVLLHGSSCFPDFTVGQDGSLHETSVFQDAVGPALERVHVAVVERRGVEPLTFPPGMDDEGRRATFEEAGKECSAEYFEHATKPARVEDAIAAIQALREQPWVREVLLAGHSEGTDVVTGILREMIDMPAHAAGLFASAGPIRSFGGYVARGPGDRELFKQAFDRVRMLQQTADDVMFDGLPVRRWRTFWLDSTPIDDVRDSTVPLFVAQGSRDDTTLPADLFALEAIRRQPDRALRYIVVQDGDHAFVTPDGRWHMADLFADFLTWALNPSRETGIDTFQ